MKNNTGQLAFITGVISFLHLVNGISISHASLTPTITVTTSSNSVEIAWEKLTSWSSSSVFMVSLSIPESVINFEVECKGGPGTKCDLDTKDIIDPLPSCTEVVVTVEASGVVAGPYATATLSPDPLKLRVNANQKDLHISWELPVSCEKSSKVVIKAGEVIVHEEYLNLPKSTYTYELSDSISIGEDLEVVVKTVTNRGESRGLKKTLLYAERLGVPTLTIVPHMTFVEITFIRYGSWSTETDFNLTISSGHNHNGDELCSQTFTCPDDVNVCTIDTDDYCGILPACTNVFVEVAGEGEVASKSSKTLCSTSTTLSTEATTNTATTTTTLTSTTLSTEVTTNSATTTTTVTSTIPPKVPDLDIKPHLTSIDIIFFKYYSWTDVTDFTFTISNGTDNTGEELCASSYTCSESLCAIKSDEYCDPLPGCEYAFVEVIGNGQVSTDSTKTSCSVTIEPTKGTSISSEGTSSQYTTGTASTETTKSTEPTEETTFSTEGTSSKYTTNIASTETTKSTTITESTEGTSISTESTTPQYTTDTASTKTTISTTTTVKSTIPPKVPDLELNPHLTSIDIIFVKYYSWTDVTDFKFTISKGSDISGERLCSHSYTCSESLCAIHSDEYCDPLPACTDVFVRVMGNGHASGDSTKTLCSTSPASTTAQYITETTWITETTDIEQFTTMSPESDSVSLSLIIGLSVGIPLALIAIAIVIYILKSQNKKPDQPMEMSQPRLAPLSVT